MPIQSIDQRSQCACGQATVAIHGKPIARFICHCTICQSLYKHPFADVVVFWSRAIDLPAPGKVEFKRYRPPPALRRGTCIACHAPVAGLLRLAPFAELAFLPARNVAEPSTLPPPQAHLFYHRRTAESDDTLPKHVGYWSSEFAVTRLILSGMLSARN